MSCDNWENGSVKIPTAEWGKTKRLFREQFNHAQELAFLKANMIYDRLMKETKGKRGVDFRDRLSDLMRANNVPDSQWDYVFQSMFPWGKKNARPFKPQKKAFPVARNNVDKYYQEELSVYFCNATHTVHYCCSENNRAVERCERSILGMAILHALRQTVYGRGTGGKFIGNDEYNRDTDCEGGGGNYVTRRFGPLGDK